MLGWNRFDWLLQDFLLFLPWWICFVLCLSHGWTRGLPRVNHIKQINLKREEMCLVWSIFLGFLESSGSVFSLAINTESIQNLLLHNSIKVIYLLINDSYYVVFFMIYPVDSFPCSNGFFFVCDEEVIYLALHIFMKRETHATKGRWDEKKLLPIHELITCRAQRWKRLLIFFPSALIWNAWLCFH